MIFDVFNLSDYYHSHIFITVPDLHAQELTHWKRPWCWERLKAGGEGENRRWDGWMASLTWWMWLWENSRSWWWTGKTGVLQSMGSQRVRHDWATELSWLNCHQLDMNFPWFWCLNTSQTTTIITFSSLFQIPFMLNLLFPPLASGNKLSASYQYSCGFSFFV